MKPSTKERVERLILEVNFLLGYPRTRYPMSQFGAYLRMENGTLCHNVGHLHLKENYKNFTVDKIVNETGGTESMLTAGNLKALEQQLKLIIKGIGLGRQTIYKRLD
jgi:hypothetical protein